MRFNTLELQTEPRMMTFDYTMHRGYIGMVTHYRVGYTKWLIKAKAAWKNGILQGQRHMATLQKTTALHRAILHRGLAPCSPATAMEMEGQDDTEPEEENNRRGVAIH
jgi:hypothetical protein